ncbi:hypothetical protein GGI04_002493 [Coemansia thaxteri]|nr:hypothetical protein GGI04_002493 [Coemansia thaxteri]
MDRSWYEFKQTLVAKRAQYTTSTAGYTDKLYLPPSFLSNLLEASSRRKGDSNELVTGRRFRAHNAHSFVDGSELAVNHLAGGQAAFLPSPLIFRLTPATKGKLHGSQHGLRTIHCGVREFSGEEEHVGIPEWILDEMGLAEGDSVAVELAHLPKGSHAQLQALGPAARGIGDLRPLLESFMRTRLTALTVGEPLFVPVNGSVEPLSFVVTALEPSEAVNVVDTDLSVDIVYANTTSLGDQPDAATHEAATGIEELLPAGSIVDLKARISVVFGDEPEEESKPELPAPSASEAGMQLCVNCGSSIPTPRLDMHRIVCGRHNTKCTRCARVFKIGSDEAARHWHCELCDIAGDVDDSAKHMHFYHTPVKCTCNPDRAAFASIVELAEHRRTVCAERLIECRFCHNIEPQGPASENAMDIMDGLCAHEVYCGSRTIECSKCKANVRIRQVQVHMKMHQMREQEARDNMVPCANKECNRERASNPLGLCATCFGPFYTGQHDPDNQKLLKRLTRALHAQLTRGCGNQLCRNPLCASGVRNSAPSTDSDAMTLSETAAATKMIPILKAYTPLCTGRQSTIDYASIELRLCTQSSQA